MHTLQKLMQFAVSAILSFQFRKVHHLVSHALTNNYNYSNMKLFLSLLKKLKIFSCSVNDS